jgi:outer membrane protein OmpA-like peptidoglycan-associated protein
MMAGKKTFALLLLSALWLGGCATGKTVVVLLPEPDGQVGEIEISNKDGARRLDQAGYAVSVSSGNAPQPAVKMSEKEIKHIFAEALAVEPTPPAKYILYFFLDSIGLKPDSRASIEEIIAEIEKRASTDIEVIGHTDRSGDEEFNMALSRRRAERVRDMLVAAGIAPAAIRVAFHGEGNPLVQTADNIYEPRNRRVEVIVR